MIVSSNITARNREFEDLLKRTTFYLEADARTKPEYYLAREPEALEEDVYRALVDRSTGSVFENTIVLYSGHSFPDIVAARYWGVEVKSTRRNQWRTTGNSVLETTRVGDVSHIYLLFGKLHAPIGFRYRSYEQCLYGIAVTHSPRYLVDMDTPTGDSIFDLMNISYDEIRHLEKPIQAIIRYYRQKLGPDEDLWSLDSGEEDTESHSISVRLWSHLDASEKHRLQNLAMVLFPEIFGRGNRKYAKLAAWLAGSHGVVSPSLRDTFTAGGQVQIVYNGVVHERVPRIVQHLYDNAEEIACLIDSFSDEEIEYYWGKRIPHHRRLETWIGMVASHSRHIVRNRSIDIADMFRYGIRFRSTEQSR